MLVSSRDLSKVEKTNQYAISLIFGKKGPRFTDASFDPSEVKVLFSSKHNIFWKNKIFSLLRIVVKKCEKENYGLLFLDISNKELEKAINKPKSLENVEYAASAFIYASVISDGPYLTHNSYNLKDFKDMNDSDTPIGFRRFFVLIDIDDAEKIISGRVKSIIINIFRKETVKKLNR